MRSFRSQNVPEKGIGVCVEVAHPEIYNKIEERLCVVPFLVDAAALKATYLEASDHKSNLG